MSNRRTPLPRTLAEALRQRGDEALGALLRARPDLLAPVPGDLTQLATRAGTRASVLRALERLDRFTLQVAEAVAVAPDGAPRRAVEALLPGAPRGAVPAAVERLRERALLWGAANGSELHLVRTARDLLGPSPAAAPAQQGRLATAGLGPSLADCSALVQPSRLQEILADAGLPGTGDGVSAAAALAAHFADGPRLEALLANAPESARGALGELVWGPPTGQVRDAARPVRAAEARTGVEWLLARGLLLPAGADTVVLPREVALALRGGRVHRELEPSPPPVEAADRGAATVDAAAAGEALTAVRLVEELLEPWDAGGPPVLRSGGMGVRELRRAAVVLEVPDEQAAFWLELAYAAGLFASFGEDDELGEVFLPTPAYDEWLGLPAAERWARLVGAWLSGTRVPGLTGRRDAKGRVLNVLGDGLNRAAAPEVRGAVLRELAALPPGSAPAAGALAARLRWRRPLRGGGDTAAMDELAGWAVAEAGLLGVTGRAALACYARVLVPPPAPDEAPAPEAAARGATAAAAAAAMAAVELEPLLPEPVREVLLQADLTAVAPGPLVPEVGRRMGVLADIESKGGATVYRFTPASVRRGLDAGLTAADIQAFLAGHSATPVPQPLAYLVDDVARRHGLLRVGTAGAYLRCDDDAVLSELLADRRTAGLGLRRLAPTVLAAQAAPDTLVARLRELGYAPAAESAAGEVVVARRDARRTGPRRPPEPVHEGPPAPDAALLAAAVRAVRAGEEAAGAAPDGTAAAADPDAPVPRTPAADILATLQAAALTGGQVLIGYVSQEGRATRRVIEPARVEGGWVEAYDHLTDAVRSFALHRMTGAAERDPA
ncbi:DNA-binding protein [Mangrovactinospora gilvigrisea]|uniref:DNA-binding protein n=1 Tax=Mangrovactinospora gilvigrisea TaxID=1428644 RepID=A0A1J7BED6_9ACTN|nr:helicase C-terminal domain-containing protein [Mangrovactinospora gilvigrisea]OIV37055.1 DNA-binding protein [Mangrovactinospora gilvigrisea]